MPESLFNKVAGLRLATFFKKRLRHRCFPVNFAKFLRTRFLQNTSGGCFCYFSPFKLKSVLNQKLKAEFCFGDGQINVAIISTVISLQLPPNR